MKQPSPAKSDLVIDVMMGMGTSGQANNLIAYLRMVYCGRVMYCNHKCRQKVRDSYDQQCNWCELNFIRGELAWKKLNDEQRAAMIEFVMRQYP